MAANRQEQLGFLDIIAVGLQYGYNISASYFTRPGSLLQQTLVQQHLGDRLCDDPVSCRTGVRIEREKIQLPGIGKGFETRRQVNEFDTGLLGSGVYYTVYVLPFGFVQLRGIGNIGGNNRHTCTACAFDKLFHRPFEALVQRCIHGSNLYLVELMLLVPGANLLLPFRYALQVPMPPPM